MATNWPPPPGSVLAGQSLAWPPPGYTNLEAWTVPEAETLMTQLGWTVRAPTNAERNAYFADVRCEQGHQVSGVMVVDTRPGGLTYPVACRCNNAGHKEGLVLWPPFTVGELKG